MNKYTIALLIFACIFVVSCSKHISPKPITEAYVDEFSPTFTYTVPPGSTMTFTATYPTYTFTQTPTVTQTPTPGIAGSDWVRSIDNAPFGSRFGHGSYVKYYNSADMIWVTSGGNPAKKDSWYSSNGLNWYQYPFYASFGEIINFTTTVYNGYVWVIGGYSLPYGFSDDVYSSTDGGQYTNRSPGGSFSRRTAHSCVAFNDGSGEKLWLIGGVESYSAGGGNISLNDVWYSSDGINWTLATNNAAFGNRGGHSCIAFNGQLWVIGGDSILGLNSTWNRTDIWRSSDGINWILANASPPFGDRAAAVCLVYNNKIWLIGGHNQTSFLNDVWYSTDGINWTQSTSAAQFQPRSQASGVVFNNQMWIIGGKNATTTFADVWHSP